MTPPRKTRTECNYYALLCRNDGPRSHPALCSLAILIRCHRLLPPSAALQPRNFVDDFRHRGEVEEAKVEDSASSLDATAPDAAAQPAPLNVMSAVEAARERRRKAKEVVDPPSAAVVDGDASSEDSD